MPAVTRKKARNDGILMNGHVVESYQIGNTRINVCDDYCVKTQAEIDEILRRVSRIVVDALSVSAAQEDT